MGTTGSYQWPNKYILPETSSSSNTDIKDPDILPNYYDTKKTVRKLISVLKQSLSTSKGLSVCCFTKATVVLKQCADRK